jgi:hypothetical protein
MGPSKAVRRHGVDRCGGALTASLNCSGRTPRRRYPEAQSVLSLEYYSRELPADAFSAGIVLPAWWCHVTDARSCEQCGLAFAPRREYARFCSARCQVSLDAGNTSAPARQADPVAVAQALEWSLTAMRQATMRLSVRRACDGAQALVVAGEAVRRVMAIDARLVRHYLDAYDAVLAGHDLAERQLVEGTLAGLRFVGNQMAAGRGDAGLIEPWAGGPASSVLAVWQWRPVPEPALRSVSPRARERQMARYRAYQTYIARRSVGEVFGRAAAFLNTVAASAARKSRLMCTRRP